ncbi:MAG: hypothetical protein U0T32_14980 [Chitinophagales bacterium]
MLLKSTVRKPLVLIFFSLFFSITHAQTPKQIIAAVTKKFALVNDYSAVINMQFDIPSVNLQKIDGKVFYKKPNKFRIKTQGIVFLPKQNPYFAITALADTNSFTAILSGEERVNNSNTSIINVIPNSEGDLILGKFWIDTKRAIVLKSQWTTKSNGTIQIENFFGTNATYALPEKMLFTVDVTKFKVPKAVAVDINSKSSPKSPKASGAKGTGKITLSFSQYTVNKKLPDAVFDETKD